MSTVCKYFLANNCKFGERCRFEHVLPDESYRKNPYVYDAREKGGISVLQRLSSPQPAQTSTPINDEVDRLIPDYLKKIAEDTNQIEEQHMWPLTCYSFLKTHVNFPGWNDISMEEVRWEAYQAQANGTTEIYLSKMQELLSHAKELRSVFLRPSKHTEAIIKDYLKRGNSQSLTPTENNVPFFMNQSPKTPSHFSFASALEQTQPSVFNQAPISSSPNIFAQASQPNAEINKSPLQTNSFFGAKSSFGTSPSNNTFGNIAGQELFRNVELKSNDFNTSGSQFQHYRAMDSQNFGQLNSHTVLDENALLYSKIENLSKEDYEAFKATTFTLENLPIVLPPKELC